MSNLPANTQENRNILEERMMKHAIESWNDGEIFRLKVLFSIDFLLYRENFIKNWQVFMPIEN